MNLDRKPDSNLRFSVTTHKTHKKQQPIAQEVLAMMDMTDNGTDARTDTPTNTVTDTVTDTDTSTTATNTAKGLAPNPSVSMGCPLVLPDIFSLAHDPNRLPWQPFRPGIEIYRLYGDGQRGPAAALLRYEPGASVPHHDHSGYEHIVVVSGSQRDRHGTYGPGTVVINPPGTHHVVTSDEGCIVFIVWEKPVVVR